jgi:hypothetical protein
VQLSQLFAFLIRDFPVRQIAFSRDQYLLDPWCCILLNLLEPVVDRGECVLICNVVSQNNALGPFVVRMRYCAEAFLASRVPNLDFESLSVNVDCFYFKVNSYK